jgi:hypothetical protein
MKIMNKWIDNDSVKGVLLSLDNLLILNTLSFTKRVKGFPNSYAVARR